jgi:Undecaprenyl-phosphate galactose phosphotransferase WbaP
MLKKITSLGLLVFSDLAALALSLLGAFLLRRDVLPLVFPSLLSRPILFDPFLEKSYLALAWVIVFAYEKLYTKRFSYWDETRLLVKSSTLAFGLIMALAFLTRASFSFSRLILGLMGLVSFAALPVTRFLTKRILVSLHLWEKRVLIIGSKNGTGAVIKAIRRNRSLGFRIVGCLTDDPAEVGRTAEGVPILGHYDEIERWKSRIPFEDIIVTFPDLPRDRLVELLRRWDGVSETFRYIPPTGDLITAGVEMENIGRVLSLAVRKNLHKPWNILIKGVFEFVLAGISFIVLLPLMALIAAGIKLDSPGPVFFRQERCGRRKRVIKIIKFRTMRVDSESVLSDLLARDARAREEWTRYKKIKSGDPRITRVGRLLRRFSLDELPQLINVLKGDMGIVGPRPYLREEIETIQPYPGVLFEVKPGITGLWQTSGRSDVLFQERIKLDEWYIRNWSVWLDLLILAKTAFVAAGGKGAF